MRTYMRTGTHEFFLENICNICICITLALSGTAKIIKICLISKLFVNFFVDTTNAHVSVAVYVSRQPTCFVHVFRIAVRETYKSCGCFFFICIRARSRPRTAMSIQERMAELNNLLQR